MSPVRNGLLLAFCASLFPSMASAGSIRTAGRAWVYGYPLVLMDQTRESATGSQRVCGFDADINTFKHLYDIPDETFEAVVRPNVDTLYSSAFLDLSEHAVVLEMAPTDDRYVLLALFDAWSNNFSGLGSMTHGVDGATYLIHGPGAPVAEADVPEGMVPVASPTDMVWIIGRTEVRGADDVAAANAVQDGLSLAPFGAGEAEPFDGGCIEPDAVDADGEPLVLPPPDAVKQLDPIAFMERLSDLIDEQGAPALDDDQLHDLADIGVGPYATFGVDTLGPLDQRRVEVGVALAQEGVQSAISAQGVAGGWSPDPTRVHLGTYDDRYFVRAVVAEVGFGANDPAFAVYQNTTTDADGAELDGSGSYTLTFADGQLPPVDAFWSVTVYDERGYLTGNAIGRYAVGSNTGLASEADGSVVVHLSHELPADGVESNWLPVPEGPFQLTLRLYGPSDDVLEGVWAAPEVVRR